MGLDTPETDKRDAVGDKKSPKVEIGQEKRRASNRVSEIRSSAFHEPMEDYKAKISPWFDQKHMYKYGGQASGQH